MKNVLNYYYNIDTSNIRKIGKNYRFVYNSDNYILYFYNLDRNLQEIYEMSVYLIKNNILVHMMIPNVNGVLVTEVDNKKYILLKSFEANRKINYDDILNFTNIRVKNGKCNWHDLWCEKIDYFEYQINEFKNQYPLLKESFNYFIGITETAIMLLNNINVNFEIVISHRRINDNSFDFYNPLNLIYDLRVRDISEYYKKEFYRKNNIEELKEEIKFLNSYELYMFFVRMLYPTIYFDLYEDIINNNKSEEKILKVLEKKEEYELYIRELYLYLKNYIYLPEIEWIKKI